MQTNHLLNGKLAPYKLHLLKSIDIDDEEDFELVKNLKNKMNTLN